MTLWPRQRLWWITAAKFRVCLRFLCVGVSTLCIRPWHPSFAFTLRPLLGVTIACGYETFFLWRLLMNLLVALRSMPRVNAKAKLRLRWMPRMNAQGKQHSIQSTKHTLNLVAEVQHKRWCIKHQWRNPNGEWTSQYCYWKRALLLKLYNANTHGQEWKDQYDSMWIRKSRCREDKTVLLLIKSKFLLNLYNDHTQRALSEQEWKACLSWVPTVQVFSIIFW